MIVNRAFRKGIAARPLDDRLHGSMSSAGDDGSKAADQQAVQRLAAISRRGLLFGGLAMAVAACVRGGSTGQAGNGVGVWYGVVPGDTLSSLSRRTGLTIERIASVNNLRSVDLTIGDRLWMPDVRLVPSEPLTYRPPVQRPQPTRPQTQPRPEVVDDSYEIVPRSAWTKEPIGPNHVLMGGVTRITIHHTDEHAGMHDRSDVDVVRKIENYHRGPERRWAAIGYHYLVGKDGKVYEGRPVKYQGAHCGDNAHNLGISMIGDYQHHLPNSRMLQVLKAFLDDQRTRYSVPTRRVYGHRDIKPTICPGDALYAWVRAYSGRA